MLFLFTINLLIYKKKNVNINNKILSLVIRGGYEDSDQMLQKKFQNPLPRVDMHFCMQGAILIARINHQRKNFIVQINSMQTCTIIPVKIIFTGFILLKVKKITQICNF